MRFRLEGSDAFRSIQGRSRFDWHLLNPASRCRAHLSLIGFLDVASVEVSHQLLSLPIPDVMALDGMRLSRISWWYFI